MVIVPQTNIILLKTPMELSDNNQLTWSTLEEQFNYFYNLPKLSLDDATYQRKEGVIRFPTNATTTYEDLLQYNYCMYQNEAYDNKWFYAYIIEINYVNDGMSTIKIETDTWNTWWNDLTFYQSFVEREHVNDDTIGKHTIPEGLETGEYICNSVDRDTTLSGYNANMRFIVGATTYPNMDDAKDSQCGSDIYNGIYSGVKYFRYDATSTIDIILELYAKAGKIDSITGLYMIPEWLAPLKSGTLYREVETSTTPQQYQFNTAKINTLDTYSPHNNKLKTFPFMYLTLSNNTGQTNILHFEKFSDSNCTFLVQGCLCPSGSVRLFPINYNGEPANYDEGIMLGKYPICNYTSDMYTNWLTQNSVNVLGTTLTTDDLNLGSSISSSAIGLLTSLGSGNPAGVGLSIGSGLTGIADSMIAKKQHNMISPSVQGNINSSDINNSAGTNTFYFYKMSIKKEYAQIIDRYFDMYGYKVNALKVPNIRGRLNWNYVKTIGCNITGNIPQLDLEKIKSLFDNGITLWHHTNTFLDYSQSNTIIS
ncbi:MAG: hypothetical protein IKI95_05885 [Clostridia bacterium]|nr:hypothetical protein [Clostridia bacterium]